MPEKRLRKPGNQAATHHTWRRALGGLLLLTLAVQAFQAIHFDINTDEFLFLSQIYAYDQERLTKTLQTFHVHLFWWIPDIPVTPINQIVIGRFLMLGFFAATLFFLYRIARLFMKPVGALSALLAYASFRYVLEYAGSFRADPVATLLLVAAGYIIASRKGSVAVSLAGALVALSTVVTIKSVFYFVPLGTLLGYRIYQAHLAGHRTRAWGEALVCITAAYIALGTFLLIHIESLKTSATPTLTGDLTGAFQTALVEHDLLATTLGFALLSIPDSLLFWTTFLVGLPLAVRGALTRQSATRVQSSILLGLGLIMLTVGFYRNAFPYYYVFLLPFPALLCGLTVDNLPWQRSPRRAGAFAAVLLGLSAVGATNTVAVNQPRTQETQRAIVNTVHEIFPHPVAYIDFASMIPSYPKHGFFMSTWGFRNYYAKPGPIMLDILRKDAPKFVLANHPALDLRNADAGPPKRLRRQDLAVLRRNFVHHWGPVYVAGKRLTLETPSDQTTVTIRIPGAYTLEAEAPVRVNGTRHQPGTVVTLPRGPVSVEAVGQTTPVTMRWGDHLPVPEHTPPDAPIFFGLIVLYDQA